MVTKEGNLSSGLWTRRKNPGERNEEDFPDILNAIPLTVTELKL